MRMHRSIALVASVLATSGALVAACGGDDSNAGPGGGDDGGTNEASSTHDTGSNGDSSSSCTTNADCKNGGVCVSGSCCASPSQLCGATCCSGSSICLFDSCVTPGKPCHSANDCGPGQYCEPALGGGSSGDGGAPSDAASGGGDGGLVCTQPLPIGGRCLPLPTVCAADAGASAPDAGCVAACEYHPPAGKLDAIAKWTWGPQAMTAPDYTDVWATPTVGRVYDGNCDGVVNELDSPNVVFVSGRAKDANGVGQCCQCTGTTPTSCLTGVLRMLDGNTGKEIWSITKPSAMSSGFAGTSTALGDVDGDGKVDIAAVTGEGYVVLVDSTGKITRTSDKPIPNRDNTNFGWGGGLAIADMDGDGFPEIAYASSVYTTTNAAITLKFTGAGGIGGGGMDEALSTFVDLDGAADNHLELLAGHTAYKADGTILWDQTGIRDGFPGVGDFDKDGKPDVALVGNGKVFILDGATGATVLGPVALPGTGSGGAPTVADFDGDGSAEIGVAMATFYSVMKPDYANKTIKVLWSTPNHDLSSSVTGSTVFDFTGQGRASVIYGDECFLWVFDGATGQVLFSAPHTSFTGTEASLVADVDGDGHAEIIMVSNNADPSVNGWKCLDAAGMPTVVNGIAWTPSSAPDKAYRGVVAFGDSASSWVGTRTLWSEHTYHVSNVCDDRDTACAPPNVYGSIPKVEKRNWTLPWLNDFRQNVQDQGIFDAPDAIVSLTVDCTSPVVLHIAVRNIGLSGLPAGVEVGAYLYADGGPGTQVADVKTTRALFPGQTEILNATVATGQGSSTDTYIAQIIVDPMHPKFHECRDDNDTSMPTRASCTH